MSDGKQSAYHIAARYLALTSKPALLWLLIATDNHQAAATLGSLWLAAGILGMILGNESHLALYVRLFNHSENNALGTTRELRLYTRTLSTHLILLLIPLSIGAKYVFPSIDTVWVVALAIGERISDEALRIRLYRKEWNQWCFLLLVKNFAPAIFAFAVARSLPDQLTSSYVLATLVFSLALVAFADPAVHRALRWSAKEIFRASTIYSYARSYCCILLPRQVASILGINIVLMDRYVGMNLWQTETIAITILIGQLVNGVFFAAEAIHLVEHRANFVNPSINFDRFWRWRPYVKLLLLCAAASSSIVVIALYILPSDAKAGVMKIGILSILNYFTFYASLPVNDYVYYRGGARILAFMHFVFYVVFAFVCIVIEPMRDPVFVMTLLLIVLSLRAGFLVSMKRRMTTNAFV
jgi:hypothetical protein